MCPEGDATPCSSRDAADSSRAVPTSAHDTPMGTSLWAPVTHWLQTQLASESTAGHQGGLQGEIQPEPGFSTWRAAEQGRSKVSVKREQSLRVGGSFTVLTGVLVEAEIEQVGIETWADLATQRRPKAISAGGIGTERGKRLAIKKCLSLRGVQQAFLIHPKIKGKKC